jgi:hypothetical protein
MRQQISTDIEYGNRKRQINRDEFLKINVSPAKFPAPFLIFNSNAAQRPSRRSDKVRLITAFH